MQETITGQDKKTVLILGTGNNKHPEALTLDINPEFNPDIVHNLNIAPWPLQDSQFEQVICHHVIEHLEDFDSVMKELHRICRPQGEIYIEVPHFSSWQADCPYHKLRFSYFSFDGFLASGNESWASSKYKFKLLERRITFHKAFRRYLLDHLWNKFPETYERFYAYLIPAEHLKLRIRPLK